MRKEKKKIIIVTLLAAFVLALAGCGSNQIGKKKETIRILSGSENKVLENILTECSKETGVEIEMTYKGSVDIMNTLKDGATEYDAVWPASSLWISLGDTQHLVKYDTSVSISPVVFGIRSSLAKKLGFVDHEVSVSDILDAINQKKLTFCMTSATQSNSGASAYIGFLYALLGKTEALTEEDLDQKQLKEDITSLLSGVDRSSGSSDWLKEMFLAGDFDAMVNYECLIIDANKQLEKEGRETLYVVYPYDGLSIADSPLGYVDHGNADKQEAFLAIQEYLLSDKIQEAIQQTGRRTGYKGVPEEDKKYFHSEWGVDTDRVLSPITMPSEKVLMKALNLYQTSFRKPSLNVYCLDFSGSMSGEGNSQLVAAMEQILIQKNAEKNLLQAEEDEINIVITFDDTILHVYQLDDAKPESLEELYESIKEEEIGGGTDMYLAAEEALELITSNYQIKDFTPAIILMTDGESGDINREEFIRHYRSLDADVPVFSIMFGNADSSQLDELAEITNARVFDGREDLISAFRSVKGYN